LGKVIYALVVIRILGEYGSILLAVFFAFIAILFSEVKNLTLLQDLLGLSSHPVTVFLVFVGKLAVCEFLEEEILGLFFLKEFIRVLNGEDLLASEAQVAFAIVLFIKLDQMLYHGVD
jgi:hypothetical protein